MTVRKQAAKKAAAPARKPAAATRRKPAAKAAPAKQKPMTLVEAVESGDYREILKAQQREIAKALVDETGPAKAALMRQLMTISKELKSLGAAEPASSSSDTDDVDDEEFSAEAL